MKMDKATFEHEMNKAKLLRSQYNTPESSYYDGYMRGLRRNYHGEKFGTPKEHQIWLAASDDSDEIRKQRGLGYKAGLSVK
jgi:hypothetical protein